MIRLDSIGKLSSLAKKITYFFIGKRIIGIKLNHLLISRERFFIALLPDEDACLLFIDRGFRRSSLNNLFADSQRLVKTLKTAQNPCLSNVEIFITSIQSKCLFIRKKRFFIAMQIAQRTALPFMCLSHLRVTSQALFTGRQCLCILLSVNKQKKQFLLVSFEDVGSTLDKLIVGGQRIFIAVKTG